MERPHSWARPTGHSEFGSVPVQLGVGDHGHRIRQAPLFLILRNRPFFASYQAKWAVRSTGGEDAQYTLNSPPIVDGSDRKHHEKASSIPR